MVNLNDKDMKCKVRISGMIDHKRTSFVISIETPEFKDETREFLGRTWTETILEQQEEWIGDNYEQLIVEEAERRFMFPVDGFKMVVPKETTKKEDVMQIAEMVSIGKNDEFKVTLLATISAIWTSVKNQSPHKIVETALLSMNFTAVVAKGLLDMIGETLKSKPKQIKK